MSMYSYSLLSKNESGFFVFENYDKLTMFENFLNNFPDDFIIVSARELQIYIDTGEIRPELVLDLNSLSNECHK